MEAFIKNLAKGAGAILREGFGKNSKVKFKQGTWDPVTKYDLASNKFLVERIRKQFPRHGLLTEESGEIKKARSFWIIDPMDGTRSFSRGIQFFCVNISFVHNDEILYAATYGPMQDELFFAAKGKRTILNGRVVSVSREQNLKFAYSTQDCNGSAGRQKDRRILKEFTLKHKIWDVNIPSGALTLAYTSAGRFDFAANISGYPWDYAAGYLLIKGAGGKVSDFEGGPYHWKSKTIVAANPVLHKKIIRGLR